MGVLSVLFYAIQILILLFLLFPFFSVILSLFFRKPRLKNKINQKFDFGLIITAYKETEITLPLVDSLLKQNYENYLIYLVADECDVSQLKFNDERVIVLKPEGKLGSKIKSILYAIDNFKRQHQYITIFDPDNLAHPKFLGVTNKFLNNGYKAVQGRRAPKNLDSIYACLDAMSEYYYNYLVKYLPYKIRSSSTIAGSGMTIETKLYLDNLKKLEEENTKGGVIVAEDKILQADLVEEGNVIAFAREAIVYDEKVSTASQVERQRTRWINSYFLYAKTATGIMVKGLFSFNWNKMYFGLSTLIPPLFILILTTCAFTLFNFLFNKPFFFVWVLSFFIFNVNIFFVLALSRVEPQIWKSVWGIPLFMFNQILALFRIKRSNKEFMETAHTKNLTIDEVLAEKKIRMDGKIRILATIRQGDYGGGETYLYNLVTRIDKNKYEPYILSFTEGNMVNQLKEKGFTAFVIKTIKPFNFFIYRKVKKILKREDIDILHIHGTRAGTNSLIPAIWAKKKRIYSVHGFSFHSGVNMVAYKFRQISERFLIKNSNLTICGSQNDLQVAKKLYEDGDIELIHNSINADEYKPFDFDDNYRKNLGYAENDFIVCFIARFTYQKDPETFVKAIPKVIEKHPGIKFIMFGEGELKNKCIKLVKTLNVENSVKFMPFTNDVKNVLNAINVFVLPSLWEVIPLGLLEAMSMKRICIATDIPGTNEALINNYNGLSMGVHDHDALSDNILKVYEDKNFANMLCENARKTVLEKFDINVLVKKNEEAYDEIYNS
jgi:glycosyltransferase involved in cell wall biosynthesis/cellulose synthase/poly-beta-1,6-N-acetylglucosamine synthase-like glycosyltransferase